MELTRDAVEFRAAPAAARRWRDDRTITPYRSSQRPDARDGFAQLLRAEWTKFRTVRGWVVGMIVAVLVTAVLGVLIGQPVARQLGSDQLGPAGPVQHGAACGQPVSRSARAASGDRQLLLRPPAAGRQRQHHRPGHLADRAASPRTGPGGPARGPSVVPWAKAGIIIKDGTRRARRTRRSWSPAATGCGCSTTTPTTRAGLPGAVSAASPALAAADPSRRHDHRVRLGRRHALDRGRHRHAGRACRPPSRSGCSSPRRELRRRTPRAFGGGSVDRRPNQATAVFDHVSRTGHVAGQRVDRRAIVGSDPAAHGGSPGTPSGITRPPAGSP